jgi:hypothetical protein
MSFHQTYDLHPFEPGETYFGDALDPSWLVSIYQSSMGDVLEECNFKVFLERLGGCSDTVKVHRVMFSGDGWYEFVAIHSSDTAAIKKAGEMLDQLKDYPILDDDRFAQPRTTTTPASAMSRPTGAIGFRPDRKPIDAWLR